MGAAHKKSAMWQACTGLAWPFYAICYASGTTSAIARIDVRQSGDIVTSSDYLAGRMDINISFNI